MLKSRSMSTNPLPRASRTVVIFVLVMIVAVFCRGLWAAEQGVHAGSAAIDPAAKALEHGHYHAPILDHFHPEDSGISDVNHTLLHTMGALDSQLAVPVLAPPAGQVRSPQISTPIPTHREPPLPGPYRPPRV